ncbi:lysine N(6)-hydroxylase/L-ornithine N(5)-oxygenase family protein [Streptomyces sp. Je 1-79]|uniref:lysine N(6)-hydroxylase/L-ornithine N(5)-oxygenase family protein n=1 Tax=Streptomyces sp. Je 1-79 TaxID=2943847 RepID=UPI0021A748DB|nr:lysine N(6)-hydroxylase/L-ornithine N(5)-oxygenase family protein [Streptomyces sp. Je 1-79]MCT4355607.1 lysine N(6)-hydroxylase/L-ornithine N(5)-oxygenase family protein [Streptomyces sp. Je 1-79]
MYDLVIVGAGPYGLSVAAHAAAHGLNLRTFGRPMESWRAMPSGMFLKSEPWASHLSDPRGAFGLDTYARTRGVRAEHGVPLPVGFFADYGDWFARQTVPPLDERLIRSVTPHAGGFEVVTGDGEIFRTRTVALAVGVLPFMEIPGPLRGLPRGYVTHSSHHGELDGFTGRDVTVVGAGQAALETAAILTEQGARARILARSDRLNWNTLPPALDRGLWQSLRAPHTGLGCGWHNRLYADTPGLFRRLPAPTRERIFGSALGPAGAWWLRERFAAVADVRLATHLVSAEPTDDGRLWLDVSGPDGPSALETDHVIAATGFTPRLDRAAVLAPGLRKSLRTVGPGGAPEVGALFESSWPGLFLAGLLTAPSYGPSMRFVFGAGYTAGRLVRGVRQHLRATAGRGGLGRPRSGDTRTPASRA